MKATHITQEGDPVTVISIKFVIGADKIKNAIMLLLDGEEGIKVTKSDVINKIKRTLEYDGLEAFRSERLEDGNYWLTDDFEGLKARAKEIAEDLFPDFYEAG